MTAKGDTASILAAAADRLDGSGVVDRDGNLLVLHHTTNRTFERFGRTADMGFHFGTPSQAAKRKSIMISRGEGEPGDPWSTVSCVLGIRNPLVIPQDPGVWSPRWLTAVLARFVDDDARDAIRGLASEIVHHERLTADQARDLLDRWFDVLRASLLKAGHDGIVYRNVFESTGRSIEWSWVAFDDSQVIRLPGVDAAVVPMPDGASAGAFLSLRGAGPARHHQDRGTGYLASKRDIVTFRDAVDQWARDAGIAWDEDYPLDYRPSFGECRPQDDLRVRIGTDAGYVVRVCSKKGTVTLFPFDKGVASDELFRRFSCDASEGFFEQGLPDGDDHETVIWQPGETIDVFAARLAMVHAAFSATFGVGAPEYDAVAPGP